jgi:hypothetical protein
LPLASVCLLSSTTLLVLRSFTVHPCSPGSPASFKPLVLRSSNTWPLMVAAAKSPKLTVALVPLMAAWGTDAGLVATQPFWTVSCTVYVPAPRPVKL